MLEIKSCGSDKKEMIHKGVDLNGKTAERTTRNSFIKYE